MKWVVLLCVCIGCTGARLVPQLGHAPDAPEEERANAWLNTYKGGEDYGVERNRHCRDMVHWYCKPRVPLVKQDSEKPRGK